MAYSCFKCSLMAIVALSSIWLASANACTLHGPTVGGFRVSYPGALNVALAVAEARREGVLPQVNRNTLNRDAQLEQVMGDLAQLQYRLDAARRSRTDSEPMAFSLVLVGPGLWAHYHVTPDAVESHPHAAGPLEGHAVVMTHPAVLRALLQQTLTTEDAAETGLLAVSGNDVRPVQEAFDVSFRSNL
jgi:hypothetical protein